MAVAAVVGIWLIACSQAGTSSTESFSDLVAIEGNGNPTGAHGYVFPPPPAVPHGDLTPATSTAVDKVVAGAETGLDFDALEAAAASGDARLAWVLPTCSGFSKAGGRGKTSYELSRC